MTFALYETAPSCGLYRNSMSEGNSSDVQWRVTGVLGVHEVASW